MGGIKCIMYVRINGRRPCALLANNNTPLNMGKAALSGVLSYLRMAQIGADDHRFSQRGLVLAHGRAFRQTLTHF